MANLSEKIRRIMERPSDTADVSAAVPLDDQSMERLMRLLCVTRDDELSCEEVFNRLDEYVDCLISREDVGSIRPLLEHHLGFCADCHDELEALILALEQTDPDDNRN